jgi:hypothetical protein
MGRNIHENVCGVKYIIALSRPGKARKVLASRSDARTIGYSIVATRREQGIT